MNAWILRIVAAVVAALAWFPGAGATANGEPLAWKGAESLNLIALRPNPARCGQPPVLEANFAGDGIDVLAGVFAVTASGCFNAETLGVTNLEATDTFAKGGSISVRPHDLDLELDPASCIATNRHPVGFDVTGGTGRYAGATGHGTYHLALNWPPCSGVAVPARVWFEGTLSIQP